MYLYSIIKNMRNKQKRLEKKSKRRGGSLHFLSYPSPLNNWGFWK